jgi:hypothetical protein
MTVVTISSALLGDRALRRVNCTSAYSSLRSSRHDSFTNPRVCTAAAKTLRHLRAFPGPPDSPRPHSFAYYLEETCRLLAADRGLSDTMSIRFPRRRRLAATPGLAAGRPPGRAGLPAAPVAAVTPAESTGPAQSCVLHDSARRGLTKEAHRRAMNQPDGLLHSEAAQEPVDWSRPRSSRVPRAGQRATMLPGAA